MSFIYVFFTGFEAIQTLGWFDKIRPETVSFVSWYANEYQQLHLPSNQQSLNLPRCDLVSSADRLVWQWVADSQNLCDTKKGATRSDLLSALPALLH